MLPEQQQRIMGYFIEEAKDHLNTIEQGLLSLQNTIEDPEKANELFRAAHSVKGGAAMLGLDSIQTTAHRMEDYFKVLKESPVQVDSALETMFLTISDGLKDLLEQLEGPFGLTAEKAQEIMLGIEPIFGQLEQHLNTLVDIDSENPLTTASSQPSEALQTRFKQDVAALLRQLLTTFKQPDTSQSRHTLQDTCSQLTSIGKQFELSEWCDLSETAKLAAANLNNEYRLLAPVLIKAFKKSQDLVLAGRASEVSVSDAMQSLLPEDLLARVHDSAVEDAIEEITAEDVTNDLSIGQDTISDLNLAEQTEDDFENTTFDLDFQLPDLSTDSSDHRLEEELADKLFESANFESENSDQTAEDSLNDLFGFEVEASELSGLADFNLDNLSEENSSKTATTSDNNTVQPENLDQSEKTEPEEQEGTNRLNFDLDFNEIPSELSALNRNAESEERVDESLDALLATVNVTGPAVGAEELNSLADLFDGDLEELDNTLGGHPFVSEEMRLHPERIDMEEDDDLTDLLSGDDTVDDLLELSEESEDFDEDLFGGTLTEGGFADSAALNWDAEDWDTDLNEDSHESSELESESSSNSESSTERTSENPNPIETIGKTDEKEQSTHVDSKLIDSELTKELEALNDDIWGDDTWDETENTSQETSSVGESLPGGSLFGEDTDELFSDANKTTAQVDEVISNEGLSTNDATAVESAVAVSVGLFSSESVSPSEQDIEYPTLTGVKLKEAESDIDNFFLDLESDNVLSEEKAGEITARQEKEAEEDPWQELSLEDNLSVENTDNHSYTDDSLLQLDFVREDVENATGENTIEEETVDELFQDDLLGDSTDKERKLEENVATTATLSEEKSMFSDELGNLSGEAAVNSEASLEEESLEEASLEEESLEEAPLEEESLEEAPLEGNPENAFQGEELSPGDFSSAETSTASTDLDLEFNPDLNLDLHLHLEIEPKTEESEPLLELDTFDLDLESESEPASIDSLFENAWGEAVDSGSDLETSDLDLANPGANLEADLSFNEASVDDAELTISELDNIFEEQAEALPNEKSTKEEKIPEESTQSEDDFPTLGILLDNPFDETVSTLEKEDSEKENSDQKNDSAQSDTSLESGALNSEDKLSSDELFLSDSTIAEISADETTVEEITVEDGFDDLEALLSEPVGTEANNLPTAIGHEVSSQSQAQSNEEDEDFDDLERLLEDGDGDSLPTTATPRRVSPRPVRRGGGAREQNMRVPVKHLDNLSNLVGELVVSRNTLERDQERLRQFLDNLLFQVQQLNDVGQRMRDLYERSLLESSLTSNRRAYAAGNTQTEPKGHATGAIFDALEMDRFTGFHTLSQEMIELIVRVRESSSDIGYTVESSDQATRQFRQITTQLQEGLNTARMVAFSQAADRLPRAVRDISLKCGKEARLAIEGKDTLIDKMIVEHLYDPLTHLVNNAITHGIETPDARKAAGKPTEGTITVQAFYQGNQTVIYVADDGGGINPTFVQKKAVQKGLVSQAEADALSDIETYELLFHPGFSTRDQADDFAGRGVGMDVVRTSLAEIRGVITVDSEQGKGTSFTIRLPLTLSISKALSCVSNQARIAFPMDGVEDMLDVSRDRLVKDEQGRDCVKWRDRILPFQAVTDLLKFNRTLGRGRVYGGSQEDDVLSIIVLRSANTFVAIQVDQVIGEEEIVIKQLEGPVPKPLGIAGATILGDGRVMPIADVLELIDIAMGRVRKEPSSLLWAEEQGAAEEEVEVKTDPTVLIVDDSITVRELLSMSFNKVGYRVEQARDGQEAWDKLRSGLPCDLVFCDIEMPRMDGLELLSRMQKDNHLKHVPIAMLTSRGADRHRQMAVDLGASGYFTKPYLEEALLDAAQRMLNGETLEKGRGG